MQIKIQKELRKQLKLKNLLYKTEEKENLFINLRLVHVEDEILKQQIKNFYSSLLNDLKLIWKINLKNDPEVFLYLKNKIKHEL